MNNKNNLDYARHNEKTCKYLDKKPDFADWVITTAFYSALHYVRYKIFPIERQTSNAKRKFKDFEQYYQTNNPANLSKHALLSELVEEFNPNIAVDYNRLKDLSWTARYNNYKFGRDVSNDAKKRLENIKQNCDPAKKNN